MRTLIIFTILLTGINLQAQDIYPETRAVLIHQPDSLVELNIMVKRNPQIKITPFNYYHWYAFDKIQSIQGAFSGNLLHGIYKVYNTMDQLVQQGQFEYGLKQGLWINWDDKGNRTLEIAYKEGRKDGVARYFREGQLVKKEEYKDGLLDGDILIYKQDGEVEELRYKDGKQLVKKRKDDESLWDRWKARCQVRKEERQNKKIEKQEKSAASEESVKSEPNN